MAGTNQKFKVDVDALFGEQAARESEANVSMRRGTRLHARKASLTHGRSFGNLKSKHSGLSTDEVAKFEIEEMRKVESEQRQTDNFWGFDKESIDVKMELSNMILADEHSQAHELYCKTTGQQEAWRREEEKKLANLRYVASLNEENARNIYMKAFYSAEISGDIMKFKWPTRPEVKPDDELLATELAAQNREVKGKSRSAGDYQIWTLEGEPSTIHLDGLQQSRTISLNGETYDPRKTASIADLAMRPAGTRRTRGSVPGTGGGRPASADLAGSASHSPRPQSNQTHREQKVDIRQPSVVSAQQTKSGLATDLSSRYVKGETVCCLRHVSVLFCRLPSLLPLFIDVNKLLLSEVMPRHCDALDGHPLYKWNAREMLRVAFSLLDEGKTGRLTREAMVSIANNPGAKHTK